MCIVINTFDLATTIKQFVYAYIYISWQPASDAYCLAHAALGLPRAVNAVSVAAIGIRAHALMYNMVAVRHVTYLTWWHVGCRGGHTSPGNPPAGRAGARLRRRTQTRNTRRCGERNRVLVVVKGNVWTGNKRQMSRAEPDWQKRAWTLDKLKITLLYYAHKSHNDFFVLNTRFFVVRFAF